MENYRSLLDTAFGYHYDLLKLDRYSGNSDQPEPGQATSTGDYAMSNENTSGTPVGPQTSYAVVVSGVITPESDVLTMDNGDGVKYPVLVGLFDDRSRAEAYKNRCQSKYRKILHYNKDGVTKAMPIYGVMEVTTQGKAKRKPPTPEQMAQRVAAMQAGRKAGKGKTAAK